MTDNNAPSMLDINFDGVYEMELLTEGTENNLRIAGAEVKAKKNDPNSFMLAIRFEDPANDRIDDIYLYLGIPSDEERQSEPKRANKKMQRIQDFYSSFNIDYSQPVIMDNIVGNTGWVVVGYEPASGDFGEKNTIKKFVKKAY